MLANLGAKFHPRILVQVEKSARVTRDKFPWQVALLLGEAHQLSALQNIQKMQRKETQVQLMGL